MSADAASPTWAELLAETRRRLGSGQEARWLLEEAGATSWSRLRGRLEEPVPSSAARRLAELEERRRAGEPLQHVLGHWSFRHLDLLVDGRALVPRPETEVVVEVALAELDARRGAVTGPAPGAVTGGPQLLAADLGTGCGAIALALAAERRSLRVWATDASPAALELASANRDRVGAEAASRVVLAAGDWYAALPPELAGRLDLVVANPPYLAAAEWAGLEAVVRCYDPREALVAGPGGLEAIATVIAGAPAALARGGSLVVELAPHQAEEAVHLAESNGAVSSHVEPDLAGRPRVLVARW